MVILRHQPAIFLASSPKKVSPLPQPLVSWVLWAVSGEQSELGLSNVCTEAAFSRSTLLREWAPLPRGWHSERGVISPTQSALSTGRRGGQGCSKLGQTVLSWSKGWASLWSPWPLPHGFLKKRSREARILWDLAWRPELSEGTLGFLVILSSVAGRVFSLHP